MPLPAVIALLERATISTTCPTGLRASELLQQSPQPSPGHSVGPSPRPSTDGGVVPFAATRPSPSNSLALPPHLPAPTPFVAAVARIAGAPADAAAPGPADPAADPAAAPTSTSAATSASASARPSRPMTPSAVAPLYTRGERCTACTVVLQGRLQIVCGPEGFECERGPWSVLGAPCLLDGDYVADFTAVPVAPTRLLTITCADYLEFAEAPHDARRASRVARKTSVRWKDETDDGAGGRSSPNLDADSDADY